MTAEDKIQLSEYNLKRMNEDVGDLSFKFDLSNFLVSSKSIVGHLLYDFTKEFGILEVKFLESKFREFANKTQNQKALKFIDWYEGELEDIKDEFSLLIWRRNVDVHQHSNPGDALIATITTENAFTNVDGYPIKGVGKHYKIFDQSNEKNIIMCNQYLERLKKMVNDAERKFKSL